MLITIFVCVGRVNFLNLARYGTFCERTYHRNFQKFIDWFRINLGICQLQFSEAVIAIDCCFINKSGKKTFGIDWFWSGVANAQKKGLEIFSMAIVDQKFKTAFHLLAKQTPAKLKNGTRIDYYLSCLQQNAERLKQISKYVCADGFFAKSKFVNGCLDCGLQIISKLRVDADLRFLFTGEQSNGRGRSKKYDGKVKFNDFRKFKFVKKLDDKISMYEKVVYSVRFKINIKLVILRNVKTNKYQLFFSTDLNLSAEKIIEYYRSRFQIEFLYRDAKQYTGLNHCQSINEKKLDYHFNLSLTAVSKAKTEMIKENKFIKPETYSIFSYKLKKQKQGQLKRFCKIFELNENDIKQHHNYKRYFEIHEKAA